MYVINYDNPCLICQINMNNLSEINNNWANIPRGNLVNYPSILISNSIGTYMYFIMNINTITYVQINGTVVGNIGGLYSSYIDRVGIQLNSITMYGDNIMYVSRDDGVILKIQLSTSTTYSGVTTFVTGLTNPNNMCIDSTGTYMYISNRNDCSIIQLNMITKIITSTWSNSNLNYNVISSMLLYNSLLYVDYNNNQGTTQNGSIITIDAFSSPFSPLPIIPTVPCFLHNSKILTKKGYAPIQDLRNGDLVKTSLNGFKPIFMIGKRDITHPCSKERIKTQLYKCTEEKYPEIFEDLIITGCHCILVDDFANDEQREKAKEVHKGRTFVTDEKYRLPACADEKTSVYEVPGDYTIYHLALEHDDYFMNYGIYANGLLVESCSKRYLKEKSNMIMIE